jgi:hypothetical protein
MPATKSKAVKRKTAPRLQSGVLKQFDCEWISYDFDIPRESFDLRTFSRKTGVKVGERWNAGVYPKMAATGYHVHFRGIIEEERVHITVEYWDGGYTVARKYSAPNAETIMDWIGSFIKEADARAMALVGFEKPDSIWKSRFNLPFKVTTSNNLELTIDGVSVLPPRNDFKAFHANISRTEKTLRTVVGFARSVRFDDFDITREITFFDEAVNMFAEQVVT